MFAAKSSQSKIKSHQLGNVGIQPKLKIGQPDDKYEREADRVADAVMRMPDSGAKMGTKKGSEQLQMQPVTQKELKMWPAARHQNGDSNRASPEISRQLKTSKDSGQSLPSKVQHEMSQKMGFDFKNIQIHTDSKAMQMNRALGARAFTHGSDIYFNRGEYNPDSSDGKHLLVHELTHTIQQKNGVEKKIQKQDDEITDYAYDTREEAEAGVRELKSREEWKGKNLVIKKRKVGDKIEFRVYVRPDKKQDSKSAQNNGDEAEYEITDYAYDTRDEAEAGVRTLKKRPEWKNKKFIIKERKVGDKTEFRLYTSGGPVEKDETSKEIKSEGSDSETTGGTAYLTFDDGPNKGTPEVLSALRDQEVPGTFFINYSNYYLPDKKRIELIKKMDKEGHSIGNHTFSHMTEGYGKYKPFKEKKEEFYKEEVVKNREKFKKLMGKDYIKSGLFRLPYGGPANSSFKQKIKKFLKSKGILHVGWNAEFKDEGLDYQPWEGINVSSSKKDLDSMPSPANILFHDYDWKGKKNKLIAVIKKLKEKFTTFSKL